MFTMSWGGGEKKNLSPQQDLNLTFHTDRSDALATELRVTRGKRVRILGSCMTCFLHTAGISDVKIKASCVVIIEERR